MFDSEKGPRFYQDMVFFELYFHPIEHFPFNFNPAALNELTTL